LAKLRAIFVVLVEPGGGSVALAQDAQDLLVTHIVARGDVS
jgi:hypothetical protein